MGGPVTLVADPSLGTLDRPAVDRQLPADGDRVIEQREHHHDHDDTDRSAHDDDDPGDVYTNQQPEPWNPSPCTLGQPTTTTTTKAVKKK